VLKDRLRIRLTDYRWRLHKVPERIWTKLAWLIPRQLAYWATIRVGVHATTGDYGTQVVPELYFVDALKRWERS
jgi:hypothetical protein